MEIHSVPIGKRLTKAQIKALKTEDLGTDKEKGLLVVALYPLVIPKIVGAMVTKGSIFSAKVAELMSDYNPIAAAWLNAHRDYSKYFGDCLQSNNLPDDILPTLHRTTDKKSNLVTLKPLWRREDEDDCSLLAQVQAKINHLVKKNKAEFLWEHPKITSHLPAGNNPSAGVFTLLSRGDKGWPSCPRDMFGNNEGKDEDIEDTLISK